MKWLYCINLEIKLLCHTARVEWHYNNICMCYMKGIMNKHFISATQDRVTFIRFMLYILLSPNIANGKTKRGRKINPSYHDVGMEFPVLNLFGLIKLQDPGDVCGHHTNIVTNSIARSIFICNEWHNSIAVSVSVSVSSQFCGFFSVPNLDPPPIQIRNNKNI